MDADNRVKVFTTVDISVASSPSDLDEAPKLLSEIAEDVKRLGTDSDGIRKAAIYKCRQLFLALSTPREIMADHCWGQVSASILNISRRVLIAIDRSYDGSRVWCGLRIVGLNGPEWR